MSFSKKSYNKMCKTIYITGCLGFIGYHITQKCIQQGWSVVGIDKLTYAANIDVLEKLNAHKNFSFIHSDITELKTLSNCDVIVNTAAETHVDNSIAASEQFVKTNVNGVHHLLTLTSALKNKPPLFLQFSCYDEKTQALTRNGLRKYNQIKIGDEVLSINPNTGKMEFKKILNVIIQDYDGEMIHFHHKSDDLMVTPNHRMYFQKNSKIQVNEAKQMCDSYNQTYLRGTKDGYTSNININGIGMCPPKDLFYVSGVFIGDGFTAHQIKTVENKSGLKRKDYLEKCRDSKGHFKTIIRTENNTTSECNSYRIYFDVPEADKARKKLEEALTNLKIQWHSEKNKSGEHIYFSSKEWLEYFEQFGKYAENKTIPDWMFDYDHTILMELYKGLIDSDGYWNKSGTGSLTTISYELVQKSCLLGYCLGFYTKYSSYTPPEKMPTFKNGRQIKSRKQSYQIFFNTQNIGCGGGKYESIHYKGKIWCLTVEDNKNFVVERNGLCKISGNTDEVYGDILTGSHTETDILKPSNPYAATKAAADMFILAWHRTYKLPYVIVRPTNNYGCYQYPEKLIPCICKAVIQNKKFYLHNNGTPMRTWLHVEDTANAIVHIIDQNIKNEIFNICGNYEVSNASVATQIIQQLTNSTDIEKYCILGQNRIGQDVRYSVDSFKLKQTGWNNLKNFKDELPIIVEHYKQKFNI